MTKQQVLYLWLAEGALDMPVVAWAFHDGAAGGGLPIPGEDPPYANGVKALEDGGRDSQANMQLLTKAKHQAKTNRENRARNKKKP